jgi:hypothetical protein
MTFLHQVWVDDRDDRSGVGIASGSGPLLRRQQWRHRLWPFLLLPLHLSLHRLCAMFPLSSSLLTSLSRVMSTNLMLAFRFGSDYGGCCCRQMCDMLSLSLSLSRINYRWIWSWHTDSTLIVWLSTDRAPSLPFTLSSYLSIDQDMTQCLLLCD